MLCDLNVPWPVNDYETKPTLDQLNTLKLIILTLDELNYTHIAINLTIPQNLKLANNKINVNPIDLKLLNLPRWKGSINDQGHDHDSTGSGSFKNIQKIFKRLTISIEEPSKCSLLSKLNNFNSVFDVISIQPLSEKALLLAVTNLDIDLISFKFDEKLPCFLKHKLICSAIEKGIKFEISYNSLLSDNNYIKRQFFTNTLSLIRSSRSRGLIISSGAKSFLELRSLFDITNLIILLGMNHNDCKLSMTDIPGKVILNGRLRYKSYKQIVTIDEFSNILNNEIEEENNNREDSNLFIKDNDKKRKSYLNNVMEREKKKLKN